MSGRVVRRVDHLAVLVSDPRTLLAALGERLGLPVLGGPTRFLGFENAILAMGDIYLEALLPTPTPGRKVAAPLDQGAFAIAFEPEPVMEATAELSRRGIAHSPPFPYWGPFPAGTAEWIPIDRTVVPAWTSLLLGGFLGDRKLEAQYSTALMRSRMAPGVARVLARLASRPRIADLVASRALPATPWLFLCEYHCMDITAGREAMQRRLDAVQGGPLGIRRLKEIVLGVTDLEEERERWKRLLEPGQLRDDDTISFDSGPIIRLEHSEGGVAQRLICEVASLQRARTFLDAQGMLAGERDGHLAIARDALAGLDIRLAESV